MISEATFKVWRTHPEGDGTYQTFSTEIEEGMVVLDAVHRIQADSAPDLAVRWNCKAGKCGSCSAEINGKPRLMCMTRLSTLDLHEPVTVEPMRAFPPIRDLVTDVSWNFEVKKRITAFKPRTPDAPDGTWRMAQADVDRVRAVMGNDYWPYGVKENRKSIDAILRYGREQGLLARPLTADEIFAPSTVEVSRV